MFKKPRLIESRIDYALVMPVFFLLLIGVVAVYISVSHDYPQSTQAMLTQQLMWIGLGLVISLVVMFFKTKFLWQLTPLLYLFGLSLMVLPLFFYNDAVVNYTGAKNWVSFGETTLFQPSEFMKISYILMLSRTIVTFQRKVTTPSLEADWKLLFLMSVITLPVLVLLGFQRDLGTALVFVAIFSGLVFISGISMRIIGPIIFFSSVALALFAFIFIMPNGKTFLHEVGIDTYQLNRISAWLNPFEHAQTTTYQQAQSLIAIGSAGALGKGFNITELLIPVRESDMIFTVIAENSGFVGGAVLIGLYALLIYRMLRITFESDNRFYSYIATGFIMMIVFHVFENIGAATGVLPLTGIPLPFISQGGSAIVSNLIGVGLVLSMSYQNQAAQQRMQAQDFREYLKPKIHIEKISSK